MLFSGNSYFSGIVFPECLYKWINAPISGMFIILSGKALFCSEAYNNFSKNVLRIYSFRIVS